MYRVCGWSLLLWMVLGVGASFAAPSGFLQRDGVTLRLDGRPFREISFNKFDLFYQFVLPGRDHQSADGRNAGLDALAELSAHGFRVIRVSTSPFYPASFEDAFFDDDPERQTEKRARFFAAFDEMLDASDAAGIRIVATLLWNWENLADLGHHSLADGFTDADAPGRRKLETYVREVVTRYRDRPTIAMWEIGNEWNLGADLQRSNGIIRGDAAGDALHPGPVVRDRRNNFTSDELAAFFRSIAQLIRSLDPNHLITTGASAPRPAAMHLLRAARRGDPVDWTPDDEAEIETYIRLIHPDPIDVISIHYYDDAMTALGRPRGSPENLRLYKRIADRIGKPLFIGEIGLHKGLKRYDEADSVALVRRTLPVLVEVGVPLTLYWTFRDDRSWAKKEGVYSLRYGVTDAALNAIERANRAIADRSPAQETE